MTKINKKTKQKIKEITHQLHFLKSRCK